MNKRFLFFGIFYVIFGIVFFFVTFGRASVVCQELKDISPATLTAQASNIFDMGTKFVCGLKYIFLVFSIIALSVGIYSIIRAFKKKVENKK